MSGFIHGYQIGILIIDIKIIIGIINNLPAATVVRQILVLPCHFLDLHCSLA